MYMKALQYATYYTVTSIYLTLYLKFFNNTP